MSALQILVAAAMLVGLIGTVLPGLPGLPLIVVAAIAWAFVGSAGVGGWLAALAILALGAAAMVASAALPVRRAASAGAPRWVLGAGAAGVVVGFFVIPVFGALLGGPLGIFVAELYRLRDPGRAWKATVEVLKAVGLGMAIEFAAGLAMIVIWVVAVLLA